MDTRGPLRDRPMQLDDRMAVRTPEHVELQFPLAGAGNRFLAVLVDLLFQGLLLLGIFVALGVVFWAARRLLGGATEAALQRAGLWILGGILLLLFLVQWGYFTLFEAMWAGQTPGKRMLKIRVVREDGRPIGFSEAAIRNLLRVVLDAQPFNMYAVAFVTGMLNPRFKRLGDYAAGTLVIRERRQAVPPVGPRLRAPAQPALAQAGLRVRQLTQEEMATLQAYLRRRDELDPKTRSEMARRVAVSLLQRLGITQPVDMSYDTFLEWLDQEARKSQAFR
ncbi:MAG TPA: RDD family protein [Candidatus Methylomirabilis sp.]